MIGKGLFHSLATTFNGYYIWGIYLIDKVGFIIDRLFYGGQFVNLPRSFALASYMFLGFIATLPALLFRKYLRPVALFFITILIIFVPMTGWSYAVIGTVGNLKFAFVFIAFLLLVYRHLMPEDSKKVYLVDAGLLICAYTDITVYFLMVFALLRYLPKFKTKDFIKKLLEDKSFQSLVVLGILLLPQLIVIKIHGVPSLPGYLDSPYQFGRTIEIFVYRSFSYGVLFPITKYMNDFIAIISVLAVIVASLFIPKRYQLIMWFGVVAIFLTTFTFVVKRTGVSAFYPSYKTGGGPDQFFYTQNWIFDFIIVLVVVEVLHRFNNSFRKVSYLILLLLVVFFIIPKASVYGLNDPETTTVHSIYVVAKRDCSEKQNTFNLSIYPSTNLYYPGVTRQQLCTSVVFEPHLK
jgi:hypothetical protein